MWRGIDCGSRGVVPNGGVRKPPAASHDDTEDAVEEIPEQKTVTTPPKTAFNSGVKKPARPQPEWMGKLVSGRSRQSFVPSKLDQRRIELAAVALRGVERALGHR